MDFGRPLLKKEGIVTRSNIHLLPESTTSTNALSLDDRLIRAANRSAVDMLGTQGDCLPFSEHELPQNPKIQPKDLVVVFESFDNLNFVYAEKDATFSNRNGVFSHNDFIGQSWGSKIRSQSHSGYGFLYLLKPTPELWARSLPHRTQIIHELDSSMIIFQLGLAPNMVMVESGTGSGALSHSALRTLAPHGHLHTFEFHHDRSVKAREEFENHNLSHLVTVHHRDVCKEGYGCFLDMMKVDAVVLDLPEPWLAIPHCPIKQSGRIACYSPCVEQVQRSIHALRSCGFHSIKTMEYRLREHYVDPVYYDPPPSDKRPGRQDNNHAQEQETNEDTDVNEQEAKIDANEQEANEEKEADNGDDESQGRKRKRVLCARPFATMKGHSAFLTFATAGNGPKKQNET
jgi:tRNA (adenine57-N1/adenine58-N1)-methyltransferase